MITEQISSEPSTDASAIRIQMTDERYSFPRQSGLHLSSTLRYKVPHDLATYEIGQVVQEDIHRVFRLSSMASKTTQLPETGHLM